MRLRRTRGMEPLAAAVGMEPALIVQTLGVLAHEHVAVEILVRRTRPEPLQMRLAPGLKFGPLLLVASLGVAALATACVGLGQAYGRRDAARDATRPALPAGGVAKDDIDLELDAGLLLRDLLESLSDAFSLWDANDRLVLRNQWMVFQPNLRRGESVRGMPFREYVESMFPLVDPKTSGGNLAEWTEKRLAWHREAEGSHEILLTSGRWILVTERRTTSGATIGIYTDITRRKKFEELRQQSERRFAHAQRLARVGIWEWDAETQEIYFSDVFEEIVGLPPESPPMTVERFMLMVHPANRDIVRSTFGRLVSSGGQYNQEYQIVRPDGELRTLRTESEAILDESGQPVRVIGAVHDMTDLKRAERALRKAMEAAAEGNRAKSEFLANVSHELRTPLNAIIGFSEVMQQEVFGPMANDRYREYAADIRASGAHLLGIINDLLDYAKLEAGRIELHVEPVNLAEIAENSLRLVRNRAAEAGIALSAELAPGLPRIEADARKVVQIVLNLLSNAVKFTPAQGTVTLSIAAAETGDGVEIAVTDTGVGMTAREIDIALAPFGQVDSSLNRQQAGTGLGLPLSRALAELHGGRLVIESAPNEGTTVRVSLPLALRRPGSRPTPPALRLVSGGQPG